MPRAVQVQVFVYDEPELGGLKIESVSFDRRSVGLQPADLYGFRGGGGFQLPPGNYRLEWTASRGGHGWPRSEKYKKTVQIGTDDTWVQIEINGSSVTVS